MHSWLDWRQGSSRGRRRCSGIGSGWRCGCSRTLIYDRSTTPTTKSIGVSTSRLRGSFTLWRSLEQARPPELRPLKKGRPAVAGSIRALRHGYGVIPRTEESRRRPRSGTGHEIPRLRARNDTTRDLGSRRSKSDLTQRANGLVLATGRTQRIEDVALQIRKVAGNQIGFGAGGSHRDIADGGRQQDRFRSSQGLLAAAPGDRHWLADVGEGQ